MLHWNERDKNCFLLVFDLNFPGWETTVITCRLKTDFTVLLVLYIHPKSLGTTLEIFHFPEAVQVFLNPTLFT